MKPRLNRNPWFADWVAHYEMDRDGMKCVGWEK